MSSCGTRKQSHSLNDRADPEFGLGAAEMIDHRAWRHRQYHSDIRCRFAGGGPFQTFIFAARQLYARHHARPADPLARALMQKDSHQLQHIFLGEKALRQIVQSCGRGQRQRCHRALCPGRSAT